MNLAWGRSAAKVRDAETSRLQEMGYEELGRLQGQHGLDLPEELRSVGCVGSVRVSARKSDLVVTVMIEGPGLHGPVSTTDGFRIRQDGKVTPLYNDEYDD